MKNSIKIDNRNNLLFNALGLIFIFLVWFGLSHLYNNSLVIPKIEAVIESLVTIMGTSRFYKLFFLMILRIIITVIVSLLIALLLGAFSYKFKKFASFINPLITIMKTIPIIAIIILLLMSLFSKVAPYVATAFVIIPLIYEIIYSSLCNINSSITDDIKTVSNINMKLVFGFYVPYIFPNIITSVIQSFGLGLKVMVMAEFMSPMQNTFGSEVNRYYVDLRMDCVFALVIIIIIVVFAIDKLMKFVRIKTNYEN